MVATAVLVLTILVAGVLLVCIVQAHRDSSAVPAPRRRRARSVEDTNWMSPVFIDGGSISHGGPADCGAADSGAGGGFDGGGCDGGGGNGGGGGGGD
jgi:hypothetical protein